MLKRMSEEPKTPNPPNFSVQPSSGDFSVQPSAFSLEEFLAKHVKPYNPATDAYDRPPFAADIKEGKNDPIYNAHSYHTKVPPRSIIPYILHYTQPGYLVLDVFCGSGMTGVAAQMCAHPPADILEQFPDAADDPDLLYRSAREMGVVELEGRWASQRPSGSYDAADNLIPVKPATYGDLVREYWQAAHPGAGDRKSVV